MVGGRRRAGPVQALAEGQMLPCAAGSAQALSGGDTVHPGEGKAHLLKWKLSQTYMETAYNWVPNRAELEQL